MKTRNLFSSVHFIFAIVIAFLIALFSYLILRSYHWRFDLSEGKVYSLSPQTVRLLQAFRSEPIRIWVFFAENQPFRVQLEDLLKEYSFHHKNFYYQFYDPDRSPAKTKQYQVDSYGTVVVEAKGKRESTKQVSEEALTSVLGRLLRDEVKRIAFAAGYGGPSVKEQNKKTGYGLLAEKLKASHYEVQEIVLSRDKISKGTDLLVIGGPRVDLLPAELALVEEYLDRGGSVLMMVDPVESGEGKNLEQFLLKYGVQLGNDVIVDKVSKLFGADYLIPLVMDYGEHPITGGFQLASFFPLARSVQKAQGFPQDVEMTELALTGAGSWAETDLAKLYEGVAELDQTKDRAGPLSIAAVVQHQKNKSRLIVFGDSDFAANAYLNLSGNKDFILNAISWLVADELAITIRPRMREITPLYLKETDQEFLFYVPVLGLPLISLGVGTGVFFWRRRFY